MTQVHVFILARLIDTTTVNGPCDSCYTIFPGSCVYAYVAACVPYIDTPLPKNILSYLRCLACVRDGIFPVARRCNSSGQIRSLFFLWENMATETKMSNGDVKKGGKSAEETMSMSELLEKFKSELESAGQDDNAEFNALRLCTMEAEVAQVLRDTGSHEKALEHFTLALELDPGVLDYWALRAQANFTMKNYREAFRDCISVHKDIRPVAMWKIGGRVLSSLGQYVLSEVWLRRASRLTEGNDYEALLLFQQTRIHRFYDPLTEGTSVQVNRANRFL
ncbi:hypothetical protein Bbelb_369560 [Branchiostoma belcheri]|nr:hypothetical protein Bbelb_369560 [Branchiostoma belcheri]